MNRNILYGVFFFVMALAGCKKLVEVDPPATMVTDAHVFTRDATATAAVAGLYSQVMSNNREWFNSGITVMAALSADELTLTAPNADLEAAAANTLAENNFSVWSNLWVPAYAHLYHINAGLEGLQRGAGVSEAVRRQLRGELLVLRALNYHYLVNFFGAVPMVTSTDYRAAAVLPRSAEADVYAQIMKDLEEAQGLLTAAYPTAGRIRPNRWAATALLARVYGYRGEWVKAEAAATAVIEAGPYRLVANPANVFVAGSSEAVWQLAPVQSTFHTGEGSQFIPTSATAKPTYALTPGLVSAYDTADKRRSAWTKGVVVGGVTYTYPYKYKVRTGGAPYSEHLVVLRLAEQYLVRAEARAQQGKTAEAKEDLDAIRARAGLPPTTAADKSALLTAIEGERRLELAFEWGHRWLDLKRWGRTGAVLGAVKPSWTPEAALYPIPLTELQRNPFLTQNPGY